jgi:hypothetical protein
MDSNYNIDKAKKLLQSEMADGIVVGEAMAWPNPTTPSGPTKKKKKITEGHNFPQW